MRIISGRNRGLKLASIGKGDVAAHLRPTTDRIRESIFNLLMGGAYSDPITDARVLDLFAGTGALGLEALSRGAEHVMFVDDGTKALSLIRQNIGLCRAKDETQVQRRNATRLGECTGTPYDLIFLDPPYGKGLGEKALLSLLENGWLTKNALLIYEEGQQQPPPKGFRLLDTRRYGDSHVMILEQDNH